MRCWNQKVCELMRTLTEALDEQRTQVLADRRKRRDQLAAGHVALLDATAHIRSSKWAVEPMPAPCRRAGLNCSVVAPRLGSSSRPEQRCHELCGGPLEPKCNGYDQRA